MPTREILKTYTLSELRDEVRKTNLKRFSVMKKAELIEKMLEPPHRSKFEHLRGGSKRVRNSLPKKEKEVLTVTKADGTVKELKMKAKKPPKEQPKAKKEIVRNAKPDPPKKKRRKRKEPEEYKRNVSVGKSNRRLRSMLERAGRLT